jgi:hypothetical protein
MSSSAAAAAAASPAKPAPAAKKRAKPKKKGASLAERAGPLVSLLRRQSLEELLLSVMDEQSVPGAFKSKVCLPSPATRYHRATAPLSAGSLTHSLTPRRAQLFDSISATSGAVQSAKVEPRAVATDGPEREGTGLFDDLTTEVHVNIFSRLELKERLTVSIAVCKAWRSFRQQRELWSDVSVKETYREKMMWLHGPGLGRIMRWMPANAASSLTISIKNKNNDKKIDAASICAAFKSLRGWKGGISAKQKDLGPSSLRSLTLHSRRVGGTVLKTAAALFGAGLQHLDVNDYCCRKVDTEDVLKVLPGTSHHRPPSMRCPLSHCLLPQLFAC